MKHKITPKQRRFCLEYLVDFNATKAAERAGYSKNRSKEIGYQLLHKTTLQKEIDKLVHKIEEKTEIEIQEIVRQLNEIRNFDIKDILTWDTKLVKIGTDPKTGEDQFDYRPVVEIKNSSEVDGKMISKISLSARGTLTVETFNKIDAIEKLMRWAGGYEKDNAQSRTDLLLYIEQASRRAEEIAAKFSGGDEAE